MHYRTYIDALLKDKTKVLDRTKYFASKSHDQMIQEDIEEMECSIQKYNLRKHLKPAEIKLAENAIVQLLNEAYRLSQDILGKGRLQKRNIIVCSSQFKNPPARKYCGCIL